MTKPVPKGSAKGSARSIEAPRDEAPLVGDLRVLVARLGLDHASFCLPAGPCGQFPRVLWTTYPASFIDLYRRRDYVEADPVVGMAEWGYLPTDWRDLDRRSAKAREVFAEAEAHGIGPQGLTIPVRDGSGACGLFTVTSALPQPAWARRRHDLARELQATALKLHALAVTSNAPRAQLPHLTPRERECLRWAAEGKTTGETATILGLSERTVRAFLDAVRLKLGAANIAHAVGLGLTLRLIPPVRRAA